MGLSKETEPMQRRAFCKLMAATAALASTEYARPAAWAAVGGNPAGFDTLHEDYAQFCATPAAKRVFYSLDGTKIVSGRLDEKSWKPTEWGKPPELPAEVSPGEGTYTSWDGVPIVAPASIDGVSLAGSGPYKPTWDSLLQYETPEWYRDAKFGIWAHWTPQCVPEDGDWYARNMYRQGEKQYDNQVKQYGHPSKFGYKDLCPQWTLLNWDPEALMDRYQKAGAKLFLALANHHGSFDTWDSKHQPWNAAKIGPHKDVVGIWAAAARKRDMRFGVTVHQARNWWWFQTAHGADATGPMAGVPYDGDLTMEQGKGQWWEGLDPQRLYGAKHPYDALPDATYVKNFYDRTRDLIDQHDPDLLYFDNSLFPLGWGGMNIGSYYYNHNLKTHGGKMEAVVNVKQVPDKLLKAVVADYERGLTSSVTEFPFQSETCIGDWHYKRELYDMPGEYGGYLPPKDVLHWLIDTVSKNGTFILNIPGMPDGTIDSKEIAVLDQITLWMQRNGEAIYSTRPWKVYGEGPDAITSGSFQGNSISRLGAQDVRFTRSKDEKTIYAMPLGWPDGALVIKSLAMGGATDPGKIEHVSLVGSEEKVSWKQTAEGLRVELPKQKDMADGYAAALRVKLG
jgi:alpha-L-fucosidase